MNLKIILIIQVHLSVSNIVAGGIENLVIGRNLVMERTMKYNCKMRMPGTVKCRPTVAY